MQQLLSNYRTMFLFRGIAAVLFGIIALVWPSITLSALVLVFGVFAVISGITAVAAALRNTEFPGWGFLLFEGILGILAGAIALAWPGNRSARFHLPAGVLGDPDRHPGGCSPALLPDEWWARCVVGAGRIGINRLRYPDCRSTFIRAARRRLVDWCLRDRVWGHVHRDVLRITLPGFEPGLNSIH